MAAKIKVEKIREGEFSVTVIEGFGESKHKVNLKRSDYARLTEGKIEPEVLVAKAFEFLLEREPKESILPHSICSKLPATFRLLNATSSSNCAGNDPAISAAKAENVNGAKN